MKKPFDKLFKVLAFPWFAYCAFTIIMLTIELLTNTFYDSENSIALLFFVLAFTTAFRFTYKTWRLNKQKDHSELLLDDLEETETGVNRIIFKDYKLSSVLAAISGLTSVGTGLWLVNIVLETDLRSLTGLLLFLLVLLLVSFGLLVIYRCVWVWREFSRDNL